MNSFKRFFFWPVFFSCQLIALALVSWHLLAQFHFSYPLGYQLLDLNTHIAEFAPQNRYKDDFELTTPEDHWRLFGAISDAVQASGKGLREISYQLKNGEITALMHEAEIIHLQDVANLIDVFYITGTSCLLIWIGLIFFAHHQRLTLPSIKKILLGFLAGFAAITTIILVIGATEVFYWFHVQVFPDGHQWFFYYQDSLMTTLMKAPDIFAFIATLLLLLLIALWSASLYGINRLLRFPPQQQSNTKARKR
ncbi:lipoprotein intramolecular transacylase Lit [Cellvibrio sp.]